VGIARCSALALVLATGATLATAGCGGCTDAGCGEGVTVDVPDVRVRPGGPLVSVTVCVDGRCTEQRGDSLKGLPVAIPVPDEDEVEISVTVRRADGRVVEQARGTGRVEIVHPNGERCDPHCRRVSVTVRGGRLS
jgi:hypothetical protein